METLHAILISAAMSTFTGFLIYFLTKRDRKRARETESAQWVGTVDTELRWLRTTVESIRNTLSEILGYMLEGAITRSSPLRLTGFGTKIAQDVRAQEWAEQLLESRSLLRETEGMSPDEVEEFCLNFVLTRLNPSEDQRQLLESCSRDNGISVLIVRRVLAIVLRDVLGSRL